MIDVNVKDTKGNIQFLYAPADMLSNYSIKPIQIRYKNYKGIISIRKIYPDKVWYGSTEFHPEPQFLLCAYDVDKNDYRNFALSDILEYIKESN